MGDNNLFDTEKNVVNNIESPQGNPTEPENFSINEQRNKFFGGAENQKSSFRVRKGFEASRLDIHKPEIIGIEKIPPTPCVIATSHLSDIDVQEVVMAVAEKRKVGIVSQETNLTFPLFAPFVKFIGKENFYSVTNKFKGNKNLFSLQGDDFRKMQDGLQKDGKTMVIAAHSPIYEWKLPDDPGIGAVILAHMANVPLVPAAVDIKSETPVGLSTDIKTRVKNLITLKRPEAAIKFADPIALSIISESEIQAAIGLFNSDERHKMSPEQLENAKKTLAILKEESGKVMESIAFQLPPEKRGKWGNDNASKTDTVTAS